MKEKIYKVLFFATLVLFGVYLIKGDSLEIMDLWHLLISPAFLALLFFFFLKWRTNIVVDEEKEKLKKAAKILVKDFDKEHKDSIFFINNNYDEPYTQSEWTELYKKLKAQNDPKALVPMYNAVVVNSEGYMCRRGLYLERDPFQIRDFLGHGDRIEPQYAIEPYTYHKRDLSEGVKIQVALQKKYPNWERAWRSTRSSSSSHAGFSFGSSAHFAPSPGYSNYSAPAQKQPVKRQGLRAYEQAELNQAKLRYDKAVAERKRHPESDRVYASLEKQAHSDYMRILAKYAGRE